MRCLLNFVHFIEGLPLEMNLSDSIVVLSAFSLFVEEGRVLIACLEPGTMRFNSPVLFLFSQRFVELLLQNDLSVHHIQRGRSILHMKLMFF